MGATWKLLWQRSSSRRGDTYLGETSAGQSSLRDGAATGHFRFVDPCGLLFLLLLLLEGSPIPSSVGTNGICADGITEKTCFQNETLPLLLGASGERFFALNSSSLSNALYTDGIETFSDILAGV